MTRSWEERPPVPAGPGPPLGVRCAAFRKGCEARPLGERDARAEMGARRSEAPEEGLSRPSGHTASAEVPQPSDSVWSPQEMGGGGTAGWTRKTSEGNIEGWPRRPFQKVRFCSKRNGKPY